MGYFFSEEYSQAKMTYNAYIHQVNDMKQQLKDNDEELKVLDVKNENAKVAEEMQAAKVNIYISLINNTAWSTDSYILGSFILKIEMFLLTVKLLYLRLHEFRF